MGMGNRDGMAKRRLGLVEREHNSPTTHKTGFSCDDYTDILKINRYRVVRSPADMGRDTGYNKY